MSTTPLSTTEVLGAVVAVVVERGRVVAGARAAVLPTVDGCGVAVAGVVDDVVDTDSADVEVVLIPVSDPALSGSEEGV